MYDLTYMDCTAMGIYFVIGYIKFQYNIDIYINLLIRQEYRVSHFSANKMISLFYFLDSRISHVDKFS